MSFDLASFQDQLRESDFAASLAIRDARKLIPGSLPILPDLYAIHRNSKSQALACLAFQTILWFDSHAVPFLLQLLCSDDSVDRIDATRLLSGPCTSTWQIATAFLCARETQLPRWGDNHELVLDRLIQATADCDRDVRVQAALTLDDLGQSPDSIVSILIDGLKSPNARTCMLAALYLGRLEIVAQAALPVLREFVESRREPDQRLVFPIRAARTAIWRIENTEQTIGRES